MDRDAIARAGRRREVLEALTFEREREAALLEQIDAVVLEEEGPRIDRAVRAALAPADVLLVEGILGPTEGDEEPEEAFDAGAAFLADDEPSDETPDEDEIGRLRGEVERSQARQGALERLARLLEEPLDASRDPEAAR